MGVPIQNYVWQQGEDLVISLVYKEGQTDAEVPVDLTGYKLRMDICDSNGPLFSFNSDDFTDGTLDNIGAADNEAVLGVDGSINISVPRSLTLAGGAVFNAMSTTPLFNYDIFLRDPQDKQHPILRGTITVEKSYTLWA